MAGIKEILIKTVGAGFVLSGGLAFGGAIAENRGNQFYDTEKKLLVVRDELAQLRGYDSCKIFKGSNGGYPSCDNLEDQEILNTIKRQETPEEIRQVREEQELILLGTVLFATGFTVLGLERERNKLKKYSGYVGW